MATVEQVAEWFNEFGDTDYLKFDSIGDDQKPSRLRDLCAFVLINDCHTELKGDIVSHAEHDEIWLNGPRYGEEWNFTRDDVLYLVRCGVLWDDENDCMRMFA